MYFPNHLRLFPVNGQRLICYGGVLAAIVALCLLPITTSAQKSIDGNPVPSKIDNRFAKYGASLTAPDKSPDNVQDGYSYCGSGLCAGGIEIYTSVEAQAAEVYNGDLIVGGYFGTADGLPVSHIARWDGNAWHDVGGGVSSETITWGIYALCIYNGELIAGGRFDNAGGVPTENIAAWDGASWHPLGEGIAPDFGVVYDMCVYDGQLIVAGNFTMAGGVPVHDLAAWDGSSWYDLPGLDSDNGMMVSAVCVYDGQLIASGNFDYPEGRIAAWDGSSWSSLGAGLDIDANDLIEYNGQLIAGGYFTTAGGDNADGIASWNGSEWSAIGSGVSDEVTDYPGTIVCFHVHNGNLIAGGYFSDVDSVRVNHIASWDGTTWSPLGSGMNENYDDYSNTVLSLTSYDGLLIAGGAFRKIASAPGNRIAGWDGSSWSEITAGGMPFAFMIESMAPFIGVPHGEPVSVEVAKVGGTENMYGFDLLIGYDADALTLTGVTPGPLFDIPGDFEWDYFEYRDGEFEGCNGDCPSELVRIIGVAELNDGSGPAISFDIPDGTPIFTLDFTVTEDTTINCQYTSLEFFWLDCGDNSVALAGGALGVSDEIWRFGNDGWENIADPNSEFPTSLGVPDSCLSLGENPPARFVNLINGFIKLYCNSGPFDWRGDINLNGIANEIADWVMYTHFFLYGVEVFAPYYEPSIAASDINADGVVLTIEDLMYQNRIISVGSPSTPTPSEDRIETDSLFLIQDLDTKTVGIDYGDTLAAVFLVFDGNIIPEFLIDTSLFQCGYWYDGENTYVLIQPFLNFGVDRAGLTTGPLFTYAGVGRLGIFGSQGMRITGAADYHDNPFTITPFNPTAIVINGGDNGTANVDPHPLPRSLLRISDFETVAIEIGNFDQHSIADIDLASLRVNDTIVPLSTSFTPPQIVVSARSFINSYYFGPDTSGQYGPWHDLMDTLSTRSFVFSVSGDFTDASSFVSLGDVTIFDAPTTIPVPSGWASIKEAVEAAIEGDTILVECGTYYDHDMVMKPGLCLRSETGSADCATIDADSLGRIMSFENVGSATTITGFTFTGGYVSGYAPDGNGGAVYCFSSSPVFTNCKFVHNSGTAGGAMYCVYGSTPFLNDCLFFENSASEGGGMVCFGGSSPHLTHCDFIGNSASTAVGGMFCVSDCTPKLTGCLFAGNSAATFGGALFNSELMPGSMNFEPEPTGGLLTDSPSGKGEDDIAGNSLSENLNMILENCTFVDNSCSPGWGILSFFASSPVIKNCLIAYNNGSQAIYCDDELSDPSLTCCDIYGNSGGDWVDCIVDQFGVNNNISVDPMFCDTANGDYRINGVSPCLSYNNVCGVTIGARGAGCGLLCGDASGDYLVNIADAVYLIAYLFREGPPPPIPAAADLNLNGGIDIGDVTMIINFIFRDGPPLECANK